MERSKLIWLGMGVGSFFGGFLPSLFGASSFGMLSVFTTAIGGFLGIWLGLKLSDY